MSVGTYDLNATANTIGNKLVIGDASQTAQLVNIVDDAGYARTSAESGKYVILTGGYLAET